MKKLTILCLLLLEFFMPAFASTPTVEDQQVGLVKNMFADFAEKLDISKIDTYYTKDFVLESNGKKYNYDEYKKVEAESYKTLSRIATTYDDIFAVADKVVSRMSITLIDKQEKRREFQVMMIAQIRDNKIARIWEVTYPGWE